MDVLKRITWVILKRVVETMSTQTKRQGKGFPNLERAVETTSTQTKPAQAGFQTSIFTAVREGGLGLCSRELHSPGNNCRLIETIILYNILMLNVCTPSPMPCSEVYFARQPTTEETALLTAEPLHCLCCNLPGNNRVAVDVLK